MKRGNGKPFINGYSLLIVLGIMFTANTAYADSWSEITFTNGTMVNTVTTTNSAEVKLGMDTVNLNWVQKNPATSPTVRQNAVMAYDAAHGEVVLFGGLNGVTRKNDTWTWNGVDWTQESPATLPTAVKWSALAYDAGREKTSLVGGYTTVKQTMNYEWDGSNWTSKSALGTARSNHALAYEGGSKILLFGGWATVSYSQDTLEWDGASWSTKAPASKPSGRMWPAMAYDSSRDKVVLFGGQTAVSTRVNDTWEWDRTTANWTQKSPSNNPDARQGHALAYDSARGKVVLFGGTTDGTAAGSLSDTWEWDGNDWTQKNPSTSPSARWEISLAYDSARGKIVLFGGIDLNNAQLNDTWEYGAPYYANGSYRSAGITPATVSSWDVLTYTVISPANTTLTIDVLKASDNSLLVASVPSGTNLSATYPGVFAGVTGIKLRANFTSNGSASATLYDWGVTYTTDTPPVLVSPGNKNVDEGELLNFTLSATDPESDPIAYSMVGTPTGATLNQTSGAFNWTPSSEQSGNYTVTFTATANGKADSETITIAVNDVPGFVIISTSGWTDLLLGKAVNMGDSVAFAKFKMKTTSGTARWKRFRIDKNTSGITTPCPDEKIEIQIWMENNNNGFWDTGGDTFISNGNFSDGTCWLNMKRWDVNETEKTYYIVYKLSNNIGGGQRAGVKIADNDYLEFENATVTGVE
jgi:hypothetical protein